MVMNHGVQKKKQMLRFTINISKVLPRQKKVAISISSGGFAVRDIVKIIFSAVLIWEMHHSKRELPINIASLRYSVSIKLLSFFLYDRVYLE